MYSLDGSAREAVRQGSIMASNRMNGGARDSSSAFIKKSRLQAGHAISDNQQDASK
ncbi:hypothetical protein [Bradyrhizobium zhanjiangense]|uniref:hypothetical protein n=1 Tax=Bradyrhizobium zhanjiangense TaxID=1325107 RepID=UPI0013E89C36|nr:hypothetical protein [Bradyrhizobium zhanjiangense]